MTTYIPRRAMREHWLVALLALLAPIRPARRAA